jgi:hypothetical protein
MSGKDEAIKDGPLKDDAATDASTLGFGGPHTHPVSAPNEFAPETGTPGYSKGPMRHEQRLDADTVPEEHREERAQGSPNRY